MVDLVRPLLASFENAHFVMGLQLTGLPNEDAVRRARGDAGSSISWIVGHLLHSRCGVLSACGVDRPNPYADAFSIQTPATDGRDYPDVAELQRHWNEVHEALRATLTHLSEEQLRAASDLPSPGGDGSLLEALAFFAWHEAYHTGVIGLLRVRWGGRHTHELAMEAMGMSGPPDADQAS